ncbi:MAG: 3-hydroxyacyl-ACP dehydratase FabZ [Chloroflexota bacterium]
MEIVEVLKHLPHRSPFLMVDRVLEISEDGQRLVALKNVSVNEPFFQGHFPGYPVMPGVLIAEALAQAGGILVARRGDTAGQIGFLAGLDNFRFRRQVVPGDSLRLEVEIKRLRSSTAVFVARASVAGQTVAEGEIMVVLARTANQTAE